MTDETTARDRAIEAVSTALGLAPYDDTGRTAVDALLAHPEVLRALAGAPTADVAAIEWGAKWSDGGYCPSNPPRSEEFARQHARNFGTRPIRRAVGPWLYDDTGEFVFADERDQLAEAASVDCPARYDGQFWSPRPCRKPAGHEGFHADQYGRTWGAAAPEGVDAADPVEDLFCPELDDDGMDLEAQGEMADQLAAAQAAIGRVERLLDDPMRIGGHAWVRVDRIERALDGDTTEEA